VLREKRSLSPTELGVSVNDLLVANLGELFNVEFTAGMEESLDKIEEGTVDWTGMLGDFYRQFEGWMSKVKEPPADQNAVGKILESMRQITEWAPEVKRGKKTYSDNTFVESVRKQLGDGNKEVSSRQLTALIKIACRYKNQVNELEKVLGDIGQADMLNAPETQPPRESTLKKLDVLMKLDLDESARKFVESLHSQTTSGRRLSDRQVNALNWIVMSHSAQIENFDQIKGELEMENSEQQPEDPECGLYLSAMSTVENWKPPVTRGRRVFDDKLFYLSLSQHYGRKKFLSVRQKAALKKMYGKYKDQVKEPVVIPEVPAQV